MLEQYGGETIPSEQDIREEIARDEMEKYLILNIYGQEAWHTDAQIVGSAIALQAVKEAITRAMSYGYAEVPAKEPEIGEEALLASDGEGYKLKIVCIGGWDDKRWLLHKPEYSIVKEP